MDAAPPARPRGLARWGCLLRVGVAIAVFVALGLIADYLTARVTSRPAPGAPLLGARDPAAGLLQAADLPAGFRSQPNGTGLIVNARKASEYPAPEKVYDDLLRWGRLSGNRVSFQRPAAAGQPKATIVAESSIFRDAEGARAYLAAEAARIPAGAERFTPTVGDAAIGWLPGGDNNYAAVRLSFRRGDAVAELALSGAPAFANPAEAVRLARILDGRIGQ